MKVDISKGKILGIIETRDVFNPLNTDLNPICHLLALLGAHLIFHVSGLRVNGRCRPPINLENFL